jgi:predicted Zn-dependent protease with MMP-like domain
MLDTSGFQAQLHHETSRTLTGAACMSLSAEAFDRIVADVWQKLLPVIPADLQAHFAKIQTRIENRASDTQIQELGIS